jgi:hypothetical protein
MRNRTTYKIFLTSGLLIIALVGLWSSSLFAREPATFRAEIKTLPMALTFYDQYGSIYVTPYLTRLGSVDLDKRKNLKVTEERPGLLVSQIEFVGNNTVYRFIFNIIADDKITDTLDIANLIGILSKTGPVVLNLATQPMYVYETERGIRKSRETYRANLSSVTIGFGGKLYPVSNLLAEIKLADVNTVAQNMIQQQPHSLGSSNIDCNKIILPTSALGDENVTP